MWVENNSSGMKKSYLHPFQTYGRYPLRQHKQKKSFCYCGAEHGVSGAGRFFVGRGVHWPGGVDYLGLLVSPTWIWPLGIGEFLRGGGFGTVDSVAVFQVGPYT